MCLSEESLHEKSHRRTLPRVILGTSPPFFLAVVIPALASAAKILFLTSHWCDQFFCQEISELLFAGEVPRLLGFLFQV